MLFELKDDKGGALQASCQGCQRTAGWRGHVWHLEPSCHRLASVVHLPWHLRVRAPSPLLEDLGFDFRRWFGGKWRGSNRCSHGLSLWP